MPRDPVWTRALVRLLRDRTTALLVAVSTAVAAVIAAGGPLFVAGVGTDVLARQLSQAALLDVGVRAVLDRAVPSGDEVEAFAAALRAESGGSDAFGEDAVVVAGTAPWGRTRVFSAGPSSVDAVAARVANDRTVDWSRGSVGSVRLLGSDELVDRLEPVGQAADGDGLWVPVALADELGLAAGDTIVVYLGSRIEVEDDPDGPVRAVGVARVAGAYQDPWSGGELSPAWDAVPAESRPLPVSSQDRRLDVLVGDVASVLEVASAADETVRVTWQAPLVDRALTLTEARQRLAVFGSVEEAVAEDGPLLDAWRALSIDESPPAIESALASLVRSATEARDVAAAQLAALTVAGVLLAGGAVAAAGAFVVRRRAAQVDVMLVRGVGRLSQTVRTSLELVPAVALGTLSGAAFAVGVAAPRAARGSLDEGWFGDAVRSAVIAGGVAAVLLVVAVALALALVRPGAGRGRPRNLSTGVLVASVVLAAVAAVVVATDTRGGTPGVLVRSFPVLLVVAAAIVGAQLLELLLRWVRPWSDRVVTGLAVRRLRASLSSSVQTIVAVAVAAGLVVHAVVLADSIGRTTVERAAVLAGATAVVDPEGNATDVGEIPPAATLVLRSRATLTPPGEAIDLVVVDADQMADMRPWGGTLDRLELDDALGRLTTAQRGGELPALAVGPSAPVAGTTVVVDQVHLNIRARVAQRLPAFPGRAVPRVSLIVDRAALLALLDRQAADPEARPVADDGPLRAFFPEVWGDTTPELLASEVASLGYTVQRVEGTQQSLNEPAFVSQPSVLSFLRLLGAIAGGIAVAVLALYVTTRTRHRIVQHAIMRRMELRRRHHLTALVIELAGVTLAALAFAIPASLIGTAVVLPAVAPLPEIAVPSTLVIAWDLIAAVVAVTVAAAVVAAAGMQRQLDTADISEALRVAE